MQINLSFNALKNGIAKLSAGNKPSVNAQPKPELTPPPEINVDVIEKLQAITNNGENSIQFELDESINELVVRVIDKTTGEVIRQIPQEEVLGVKKALRELVGMLLNTQS